MFLKGTIPSSIFWAYPWFSFIQQSLKRSLLNAYWIELPTTEQDPASPRMLLTFVTHRGERDVPSNNHMAWIREEQGKDIGNYKGWKRHLSLKNTSKSLSRSDTKLTHERLRRNELKESGRPSISGKRKGMRNPLEWRLKEEWESVVGVCTVKVLVWLQSRIWECRMSPAGQEPDYTEALQALLSFKFIQRTFMTPKGV